VARSLPSSTRTHWADVGEVSSAAEDMPLEFLDCRDFRHAWRRYSTNLAQDGTWERVVRCLRCGVLRTESLTRTGGRISHPRYEYPDGYLIPQLGRIGGDALDALRLVSLVRGSAPTEPKAKGRQAK
jgi:hypothetical protein